MNIDKYQNEFTSYLRGGKLKVNLNKVNMKVYKEVIFKNINETISACFPVAKSITSQKKWLSLISGFIKDYQANSPIFRDIPNQFLDYMVQSKVKVPEYYISLLHYEWLELDLMYKEDMIISKNNFIQLNPILELVSYDYAVHKISPKNKKLINIKTKTNFCIYRNKEDKVIFVELNEITLLLLSLIKNNSFTFENLLFNLSKYLDKEQSTIKDYLIITLKDLCEKEIVTLFSDNY